MNESNYNLVVINLGAPRTLKFIKSNVPTEQGDIKIDCSKLERLILKDLTIPKHQDANEKSDVVARWLALTRFDMINRFIDESSGFPSLQHLDLSKNDLRMWHQTRILEDDKLASVRSTLKVLKL